MKRPIITMDLLEKGVRDELPRMQRASLLSTGKWTIASGSWQNKFHESAIRVFSYRYYMLGVVYKGL